MVRGDLSMTSYGDDPRTLIHEALSGGKAAQRSLERRLTPVIRARVGRRLSPSVPHRRRLQEDLVQEVWVALLRDGGQKLRAYDPAGGATLEGFVGRAAEWLVLNQLTKMGNLREGGEVRFIDGSKAELVPSEAPSPEAMAIGSEHAEQLLDHLWEGLSDRGRLIFRYVYSDGRAPAEVAAILGVKKHVVSQWQFRIRELARRFLTPLGAAPAWKEEPDERARGREDA
jgi:RNA polymerase sigma factor (sigma-70 family)